VTRRLKAKPETAAIPVIALTAHGMQDDEERAQACGCDDYLAKPIDEDRLFARLARFLGPRRAILGVRRRWGLRWRRRHES
jgi:two-component system cell cycle response regulator DivK